MFYRDFFVETNFISGYSNKYWNKTIPLPMWQAMVSVISQIPSL